MHGLGNDFVFINKNEIKHQPDAEFITKISDRKTGLGCDQLIIYARLAPKFYSMEIYNPDGSKAGMCGNATRCLALNAFEEYGESELTISINNRNIKAKIVSDELIEVNMGPAGFDEDWMQKIGEFAELVKDYQLNLKELVYVDMGNPHIVIFYDNLSAKEQRLLGQTLQHHTAFLDGINVNFAQLENDVINLKVFERGVGFTLACGSGACATFAAATKLKFVKENAIIRFEKGDLNMSYSNLDIIMTGPAQKIAVGYYNG